METLHSHSETKATPGELCWSCKGDPGHIPVVEEDNGAFSTSLRMSKSQQSSDSTWRRWRKEPVFHWKPQRFPASLLFLIFHCFSNEKVHHSFMECRQKSSISYMPPWVSSGLKVLLQPGLKLSLGSKVSCKEFSNKFSYTQTQKYIQYSLLLFHWEQILT